MILRDFHVHTVFCDGTAEPETMVRAAIDRGLEAIGFSAHSPTAFDRSWCMVPEKESAYRAEIARLKEVYGDRIRIYCGLEQDFCSEPPAADYDYLIGAVHYLPVGGEYILVDESAAHLRTAADRFFGGDLIELAAAYYETEALVAEKTRCDLIAHFDLITKFNEGGVLFYEDDPRYREAWQKAADRLLQSGVPFEINTGAIFRGWRSTPYPAAEIREYLAERGARFLLSGDSHAPDALCFGFEELESLQSVDNFPPV